MKNHKSAGIQKPPRLNNPRIGKHNNLKSGLFLNTRLFL